MKLFAIALLFASSSSFAVFTTGESTEVIKSGTFDVGAEPQFMLSGSTGLNVSAFGDYPITDESSVRAHLGTGSTSFDAGASFKWIPIPDYQQQPGIGGKVELETFTLNATTTTAVRLEPLIGKRMHLDQGDIIPYAAVPVDLMNTSGNGVTGLQLVAGTEYHHPSLREWTFAAEIGVNLNNTNSYISGLASYSFSTETPRRRIR